MPINNKITFKSSFEDKLHSAMERLSQKHITSICAEAQNYSIKYFDGSLQTINKEFANEFTNECFPVY